MRRQSRWRTDASSPRPCRRRAPSWRRQEHDSVSASSRPWSRWQGRPASASRCSSTSCPEPTSRPSGAVGRRPRRVRRRRGATARMRCWTGWRSPGAIASRTATARALAPRPAGLRFRRERASPRGRPGRRARRSRRLGRRAAEVRGRLTARPLPPADANARGGDGGRPEPGRPSVSGEIDDWREDVSRLLANDGLPAMPVLVVSARTGEGLDSLRRLLSERVAARAQRSLGSLRMSRPSPTRCASRAATGSPRESSAPTVSGSLRRSRRLPVSRGWSGRSIPRTGIAGRSRPAGRSSAGFGACGRIRSDGFVSATALPRARRSRVAARFPAERGAACPGCDGDSQSRRSRGRRPAGTVAHARPRRSHGE